MLAIRWIANGVDLAMGGKHLAIHLRWQSTPLPTRAPDYRAPPLVG